MGAERNYARFYALLRKLPGADKETLVEQFTNGRTTHLHETTEREYRMMCDEMECVGGYDERRAAWKADMKKKRSLCLHLMQRIGVNTADWPTVNRFCENPKLGGKPFARLTLDELEQLQVKLRMIERRGGLKPRQSPSEKKTTSYIYLPLNSTAKS